MCYGMNCPYEILYGPNAGECKLHSSDRPADAVCIQEDREAEEEEWEDPRDTTCKNCRWSEYLEDSVYTDHNQEHCLMICENWGADHHMHILLEDHPCDECELTEI